RARKNLVEKTEGKPFREVFRGKSEIDLGRVNLNLALKQREPQGCLENRNSLSGKLVLSPKLRAKIAELGGAVVVATPQRQPWEFFQTQRLDAAQAEQTLNLQG